MRREMGRDTAVAGTRQTALTVWRCRSVRDTVRCRGGGDGRGLLWPPLRGCRGRSHAGRGRPSRWGGAPSLCRSMAVVSRLLLRPTPSLGLARVVGRGDRGGRARPMSSEAREEGGVRS